MTTSKLWTQSQTISKLLRDYILKVKYLVHQLIYKVIRHLKQLRIWEFDSLLNMGFYLIPSGRRIS